MVKISFSLVLFFAVFSAASGLARATAQVTTQNSTDTPLASFVTQQFQGQHAAHQSLENAPRIEVRVGELDPRLKLRACADIEPFLPPGTRLWGRAYLGMRCKEPRGWTAFIPVDVKVFAKVPVAARLLNAGETVSTNDLRMEERDLTKLGPQGLPRLQDIEGRVLLRGFAPGQVLVTSALRAPWVVTGGEEVKVVIQGHGFFVSTSATALTQAESGKNVPVKLSNGRTLQGIAQPGRIVEVKL